VSTPSSIEWSEKSLCPPKKKKWKLQQGMMASWNKGGREDKDLPANSHRVSGKGRAEWANNVKQVTRRARRQNSIRGPHGAGGGDVTRKLDIRGNANQRI